MIWVETLSRHKEPINRSRHAVENGVLSIGRGYDNDVVVDDPCVASQHLILRRNERGVWCAEDRGTQNGLLDENNQRHAQLELTGDTLFRVGQTWLRVRSADFPVAPEQLWVPPRRLWPWILLLIFSFVGGSSLEIWMKQTSKLQLTPYIEIVQMLLFLAIWAACWAGASRLLSGTAHFTRHTLIALTALTLTVVFGFLFSWIIFAFSFRPLSSFGFTLYWLVAGVMCFYHLRTVSARRLRLKAIIVATLCITATTIHWISKDPQRFQRADNPTNPYLSEMWPPAARMIAPKSQEAFFDNVEKIKTELDEARKKEPEGGGFFSNLLGSDG